jgi:hypothetical protein
MNQVAFFFLIGVVKQLENCNFLGRVRIVLSPVCLSRCLMPRYDKCQFPSRNFGWWTGYNIDMSPKGADEGALRLYDLSVTGPLGRQSASA